jgi:large subunit ribosomal protein L18
MKNKKVRKRRVIGTQERPRLVVYRSLNKIYAQIIDDDSGKTLISVSSLTKGIKEQTKDIKGKISVAKIVGKTLAEEALKHSIKKVVFDRGNYLYHGRVKAVAEGAREGGLEF